jgi:hypothetical protein
MKASAPPSEGPLMSTMNDYSAAEWQAISTAPAAVGLAMTLSDFAGGIGDADETTVLATAITRELLNAPEIVRAVAERFSGGGRPELPVLQEDDQVHSSEALIATIRNAVRAIETKSPTEVEGFKAWLASVAAKVCHATSPGGGGTQVSHERQEMIDRLTEVLAVCWQLKGPGTGKEGSIRKPARRPKGTSAHAAEPLARS